VADQLLDFQERIFCMSLIYWIDLGVILSVIMLRMYKAVAVLSALMNVCSISFHDKSSL